ncbi:hypothetical protein ACFX13_006992 [Malus domestica]
MTPHLHLVRSNEKKEGKRVALQAKVDELEAQNNKIAMKNEVLQEQYKKLFETLHETRRTQTRKLIAPVDINHHLGNTEGHLPSTWLLRPEAREVEEDTSLHKGWKDRKSFIVPEEHEGIGDSEVFRQTRPRSQYGESKEKSHALAQTFLLPIVDGDLRKKIPVVHDSTQDPLVLQLVPK